MKKIIIACVLATAPALPLVAFGAEPTGAPAPAYSTSDTLVGELLDNPATRAVLDKHIPGFSTADQIDGARNMTLRDCQQFAPDTLTDEVLAKIDTDLAKLPAPKQAAPK